MSNKVIGVALICLGLLVLVATIRFKSSEDFLIKTVVDFNDNSCVLANGYCLHTDRDYSNYLINLFASFMLLALGSINLYISFFNKELQKAEFTELIAMPKPKDLDEEESIIYSVLKESNGIIFQSDLVKKTMLSKVKVTRLLDKLESKNLIERKRRGMSNLVVIKRN